MEIAIFGGTFNPPTKAHQTIIRECANLSFIDEVWVMPSGQRKDKQFETSDHHRIVMLEAVIGDIVTDTCIRIEQVEMQMNKKTSTTETYRVLRTIHPKHHFWFVFGMDAYMDMPNWKGGQELRDSMHMLVVPRDERIIEPTDRVRWLPINHEAFTSSTEVRNRVAAGQSIDNLVCSSVARYIFDTQLYSEAQVA